MPVATQMLDASLDSNIETAAEIIRNGGLVAFATETVYGLGALGLTDACQKIFTAKGRPENNPLILHVPDLSAAKRLFTFETSMQINRFEQLAKAFWPGPLTIVCQKSHLVPDKATSGLPKVAVRVPAHPAALKLLALIDAPVAAPSANASTRPSPTCAEHVQLTLDGKIDAILDAGPCAHGLESTILDISGDRPQMLRPGAIGIDQIEQVIGPIGRSVAGSTCHIPTAPGQLAKHYAPNIENVQLASFDQIQADWHQTVGMILTQSTAIKVAAQQGQRSFKPEVLPNDSTGYGYQLYAALYRIELTGCKKLLIEEPSSKDDPKWHAIWDRLIRACR